ncbi:39S ribosomal protein L44, mitochondrial [Clonorchis sinensis]|uniref:Large ribosomal subunit protein mL44 n=1 Tax=Clonorchis sinensis TaxID=79923 RepID=A0A8T1M8V3_CLOSI|nr:39S ribosomal protein L44, mitochondrial [Clonorchis sinensis]
MRLLNSTSVLQSVVRFYRNPRWLRPYLRDLYYRRLDQGPEPYRPRSFWPNWDNEAELGAFCHRIGENIPTAVLSRALTDKSYAPFTASSSTGDALLPPAECNTQYIRKGHELAESYICAFLRHVYPRVPEEWIVSIVDCLLSTTQLSFTAANLGLRDLVLYGAGDSPGGKPGSINPPSPEITSNSLLSIVGALAEMDLERAYLFIRDFLLTPLVDLDLTGELVVIENPLPLLHGMLLSEGKPPPESRLQYQTGMNTLVACYQVGIYSGETLVGEAPGETPEIAEQEAARQAIRNMVGLSDHRPPLPLYGPAPSFDSNQLAKRNVSVSTYLNLLIQQPQCNLAH